MRLPTPKNNFENALPKLVDAKANSSEKEFVVLSKPLSSFAEIKVLKTRRAAKKAEFRQFARTL